MYQATRAERPLFRRGRDYANSVITWTGAWIDAHRGIAPRPGVAHPVGAGSAGRCGTARVSTGRWRVGCVGAERWAVRGRPWAGLRYGFTVRVTVRQRPGRPGDVVLRGRVAEPKA